MEKKYYKIDVKDLSIICQFGFRKNPRMDIHLNNFVCLEALYKVRYPLMMQNFFNAACAAFRSKTDIPNFEGEIQACFAPEYFLVSNIYDCGTIAYEELLTGTVFMIPGEFLSAPVPEPVRTTISSEEVVKLFDDNYISRIGNFFYIIYDQHQRETKKNELVKKLKK